MNRKLPWLAAPTIALLFILLALLVPQSALALDTPCLVTNKANTEATYYPSGTTCGESGGIKLSEQASTMTVSNSSTYVSNNAVNDSCLGVETVSLGQNKVVYCIKYNTGDPTAQVLKGEANGSRTDYTINVTTKEKIDQEKLAKESSSTANSNAAADELAELVCSQYKDDSGSVGGLAALEGCKDQAKKNWLECSASGVASNIVQCLKPKYPKHEITSDLVQSALTKGADAEKKVLDDLAKEPEEGDGEDEEEIKTCGTEMTGIGWIVCPITNAAIGFADMVWGIFETMLKTDPLQQSDGKDDGIYYKTWQSLRNIANVLFVVAFLIVILSQVSNIGLSNYSIKKIMPRLIIVAIAINISFLLVQISVDLANILGSTILDIFEGAIKINSDISWGGLLQEILTLGATGAALGFGIPAVASTGFAGPLIIFLLLMLIPAIVGLLAGFLTLVIRSALIPVIAIFAPLALVAYIFPNGQSIFDKWRKTFTSLLLLYPLSAIYYGALKFTASIMINGQGILERMIGHTLLFIGCFVVLGIALKGNSITGKAFGAINGGINKFIAPARKIGMGVAGGMAALKFAQFKNRDFSTAPTRRRFDPRRVTDRLSVDGVGRSLRQFDDSQMTRKRATEFAKESALESYDDRLLAGYDPNNPNTISKMALDAAGGDRDKAKVMLDRLQATRKAENLKKSMSTLQVEYAREKAAGNSTDDFLANRALHATSDSDRDAALHMAAQTGRSTVIRKIQSDPTYATNTGLQTATQEAISANTSSLVAKAPDLVKGEDPAFRSVTGEQLAAFSEDTIGHYLSHIERQISAGNTAAAKSLLGAVKDIQRNPTIQAKFVDRAGLELLDKYSKSPVLSSNPDVAAAASAIGADGKIR